MSIHKSLRARSALERRRNVLTRAERLEILKKEGKWKEGESVYGLPLVHLAVRIKKAKPKKAKADEAAAAAGGAAAPAAGAAAPAAAAAGGKAAAAAPAAAGKKGDSKKPEKK
jgi:small basic protein (TIGR04137 family)